LQNKALEALIDMKLKDDQGNFNAIMVPVIQQQAAILDVDPATLITLLGWSSVTLTFDGADTTTTTAPTNDRSLSAGALAGIILGSAVGVVGIGCLLWAAGVRRRRTAEEEEAARIAEEEAAEAAAAAAGAEGTEAGAGATAPTVRADDVALDWAPTSVVQQVVIVASTDEKAAGTAV
jgi:hypothetical protein